MFEETVADMTLGTGDALRLSSENSIDTVTAATASVSNVFRGQCYVPPNLDMASGYNTFRDYLA